ncbi:MAG TPA: NAD(P)-dependent alcohol dehydrogenase [Candidatus Binataceae bacterium]|jgi:NAD+-dependent secondary alcohol dehydrogenase Adh1|nr:NAD(P)-dependent alcohol dehydrogenase [Candidatus Binataceae bacterium]
MKAAVLNEYDTSLSRERFVAYKDAPDPKIENPTDIIVRIGGAGVCRTDLHVIEGLWRDRVSVKLPYIMGHENAGWVEAAGKSVQSVKVGDPVICHPLLSRGETLAARRGNDMHAGGAFPGIDSDGGYAELLKTSERAVIPLPRTLAPKDVAPYADAGLTAYHAAKKAAAHLVPGEYAVVIGAGGLGHIGIQALKALCAAEIVVVDRSEAALGLARECGADHAVKGDGGAVDAVLSLTGGLGAQAVIDFVGEGDSVANGLKMTRNAGYYYIVGYGGKVEISTMDMIVSEKTIVGNLVGSYPDLVELMALADRGKVKLATKEYRLADANAALHDLKDGRVKGRAVLIP